MGLSGASLVAIFGSLGFSWGSLGLDLVLLRALLGTLGFSWGSLGLDLVLLRALLGTLGFVLGSFRSSKLLRLPPGRCNRSQPHLGPAFGILTNQLMECLY